MFPLRPPSITVCLQRCLAVVGSVLVVVSVAMATANATPCDPAQTLPIKQQLLAKAQAYQGQGDPDHAIQTELDVLVNHLLQVCPQAPLKERLPLLSGMWQQVWGPYSYRDNRRGVDKSFSPTTIYQVVFPDGYYYNVSPTFTHTGQATNKTTLLRGQYRLNAKQPNVMDIHFTALKSVPGSPPQGLQYGQLPALAESGQLLGVRKVLPNTLVWWLLGGGTLTEVYTDNDLRITYGASKNLTPNYLFVLRKVTTP
jgi:hypothetical protein